MEIKVKSIHVLHTTEEELVLKGIHIGLADTQDKGKYDKSTILQIVQSYRDKGLCALLSGDLAKSVNETLSDSDSTSDWLVDERINLKNKCTFIYLDDEGSLGIGTVEKGPTTNLIALIFLIKKELGDRFVAVVDEDIVDISEINGTHLD